MIGYKVMIVGRQNVSMEGVTIPRENEYVAVDDKLYSVIAVVHDAADVLVYAVPAGENWRFITQEWAARTARRVEG